MMNRTQFVQFACAQGLHAIGTPGDRPAHARNLKATAEAMADELGLKDEPALSVQGSLDEIATLARRIEDLEEQLAKKTAIARGLGNDLEVARARVRELEQDLEKATAPKGKASR